MQSPVWASTARVHRRTQPDRGTPSGAACTNHLFDQEVALLDAGNGARRGSRAPPAIATRRAPARRRARRGRASRARARGRSRGRARRRSPPRRTRLPARRARPERRMRRSTAPARWPRSRARRSREPDARGTRGAPRSRHFRRPSPPAATPRSVRRVATASARDAVRTSAPPSVRVASARMPASVNTTWVAIATVMSATRLAAATGPGTPRRIMRAAEATSPPTRATGRRPFTASRTHTSQVKNESERARRRATRICQARAFSAMGSRWTRLAQTTPRPAVARAESTVANPARAKSAVATASPSARSRTAARVMW